MRSRISPVRISLFIGIVGLMVCAAIGVGLAVSSGQSVLADGPEPTVSQSLRMPLLGKHIIVEHTQNPDVGVQGGLRIDEVRFVDTVEQSATPSPAQLGEADARRQEDLANDQALVEPAGAVMSENFEGTWPAPGWQFYDNNSGAYVFGKRNCHPHAGSYGGWSVGGGSSGSALGCSANYPNNTNTMAAYGPFDLSDATAASLTFYVWGKSQPRVNNACVDMVYWGSATDEGFSDFSAFVTCGDGTGGTEGNSYYKITYDLSSRLGESQVWIAVGFLSDASVTDIGFTIDDVQLDVAGTDPLPGTNAVVNGDFEQGRGVGWIESSMQFRQLVKTGAAHGGTWLAELGDGASGTGGEAANINQTITVPAGAASLTYWYKIKATGSCLVSKAAIILGTTTLKRYQLCGTTATSAWVQETINLAEYVGQTLKLMFFVETEMLAGGGTSFYVDDVVVSEGEPVPPPTPEPPDSIVNGGFESGPSVGWSRSSNHGLPLISQGTAHGGSWRAELGNLILETAVIAQTVRVPAAGATLEYWYKISSTDVCLNDYGSVYVGTGSSGTDLTELKKYVMCATSATSGYVHDEVSLAAYAGQAVAVSFRAFTDGTKSSTFYVDDVVMRSDGTPPPTYTVSGHVTASGAALAGATISDGAGHSAATDTNGAYTLSGLTAGSYTLTPAKSGCTFTPASLSETVPPSRTGQDFTATCTTSTYTISGRVTASGAGLAGTTISEHAGHSVTTDTNGNYTISGLAAGSYLLTPTKSGCTFEPSLLWPSVPPSLGDQDFTATCTTSTYTVSGRVTASGAGLSGVTISDGAGHSATTDTSGNYTFSGAAAGSYTVTPAKSGCTFTPASLSVSLPPSRSGQDFTATCTASTYTVSGQITDSASTATAGATVSVTGPASTSTTSGGDGRYTLSNLPAGTYSVSASKTGYTAPAAQSVTLPPSATGVNFVLQPQSACGAVSSTTSFTSYYGDAVLNGQSVIVGTIIEAFSPRGDRVGCFQVTSAGLYGYVRVYGEDASISPIIPGMRANEEVTFKISNTQARSSSCPVRWQDDKSTHEIDLTAPGACTTEQKIDLHSGLNWYSISRQPVVTDPASVLSTISGKYSLVLGEDGTYAPLPADPRFNTLGNVVPGKGYMIRMNQSASLTVTGSAIAANSPLSLVRGLRWLGYLPERTIDVPTALASISGKFSLLLGESGTYAPPPADPRFNTLQNMEPGRGNLIRMTQDGTLTYPATLASHAPPEQTPVSREQSTGIQACSVAATPYFTQFYGQVTVDGQPVPLGALVEAVSPRGDQAGCFQVTSTGLYGYMRVYGEDTSITPSIPGMRTGETVTFKVNGRMAEVAGNAAWQDDKTIRPVNLTAPEEGYRTYLPLIMR